MFNRIIKRSKTGKQDTDSSNEFNNTYEPIPRAIKAVETKLNNVFSGSSDFVSRKITCGKDGSIKILVSYIKGFVDKRVLNQDAIRPILEFFFNTELKDKRNTIYDQIKECVVNNNDIKEVKDMEQAIDNILCGNALIFINGEDKALVIGVKAPQGRQVSEPDTETSIRGAREGFVENLLVNTVLIRKRIKNPNLKIEKLKLGEQTRTDIRICYIKGIADEKIVEEVKKRLKKINIDAILDTGQIEQLIRDSRLSLFPTIGNSEKSDKLASKLLEGRVAILCDGTPHVLTVPYLFIESIQAADDYYDHAFFATFMRLIRLFALLTSNLLPAIYVALVSFHHTIIPFKLMINLASSRQGIPFSPFTEAVLMIVVFELLSEAGIRMPKPIGQALSIVGAIVLGEASVAAGIASNLMVIIISITAVCSFIVPPLIKVTTLMRFVFLLAANFLGFFGITFVFLGVFIHLCRLRSFGIPYLAPFSPLTISDIKDSFIVVPIWAMLTRPRILHNKMSDDIKQEQNTRE